MYKRPLPRPKKGETRPLSQLPTRTVPENKPTVVQPEKKPKPQKNQNTHRVLFPEHVSKLFEGVQHRPAIGPLVEAMTLDGYPAEKIIQAKKFYAWLRNTDEQRQTDLDRLFVKYNTKMSAPPKKILKVVKKKI